ncbi:ABC transporter substrate-binding protein [Streptomyces sp. NPDC018026]|uniref:ABC transporter substrate-binding protein n=1 Tax=Streptomyces sp. NPDC018026 TaxID=3365031 RepID=UPI00379B1F01
MRITPTMRALALMSATAVVLAGCDGRGGDEADSTPGVTDDSIVIGMTAPLSGPLAANADAAKGFQAYIDSINAHGGIHGRKIKLIVRDDAYDPAKAVTETTRLVVSDKVFALVGGVGSATQLSVYKQMNDQKVPMLLLNTSLDTFVEPLLPYVSLMLPSTKNEQKALINFARNEYKNAKVGVLLQNDDIGHTMTGVWQKAYGDDFVAAETYDTTDTDVANQIAALRRAGAEVVVFLGSVKFTSLGLLAMQRDGWDVPRITQSTGFDTSVIETAGDAAEGIITVNALKPGDSDEPGVAAARDILKKYGKGLGPNKTAFTGIANGMVLEQILKDAGKDLTRESLMKAHDSLNMTANGPWYGTIELSAEDHEVLQCEQLLRNDGGSLTPVGDVVCP